MILSDAPFTRRFTWFATAISIDAVRIGFQSGFKTARTIIEASQWLEL